MKCSTVSGNVAEYRRTCRLLGRCESSLSRIPLKSWERSLSASSRHRIRHFSTLATFLSIKSRIRPGVATTKWTEKVPFNSCHQALIKNLMVCLHQTKYCFLCHFLTIFGPEFEKNCAKIPVEWKFSEQFFWVSCVCICVSRTKFGTEKAQNLHWFSDMHQILFPKS